MKSHHLVFALVAFTVATGCGKKGKKPEPATTPPAADASQPEPPAADASKPPTEPAPDVAKAEPADVAAAAPDVGTVAAEPKLITTTTTSKEALAELQIGEALMYDARDAEGIVHFKKAAELDPGFAFAWAMIGSLTPGPEGTAMLDKAVAAAATLPEAERARIEAMLADRRGEDAKSAALEKKVVELAPDDWRGHVAVGMRARRANDATTEIAAYRKAAELAPTNGSIHNSLGYAYMGDGKKEEAIAEFKRYTELAASEPNPHDSLAEALLAAGKLAEAEASFRKALEVSPTFFPAWGGVAACRALSGDWPGAKEAAQKALDGTTMPGDRVFGVREVAVLAAASGDVAGAVAMLTKLEEETTGDPAGAFFAGLQKTMLLIDDGKLAEAEAALTAAIDRAGKSADDGAMMAAAKRTAAATQAILAARQGKAEDAQKHLAVLAEMTKTVPGRIGAQSQAHMARGVVLAETDAKAAIAELEACMWDDFVCKRYEVVVREKAGDKEGAAAARQKLVDWPQRMMGYVYVRAQLKTIPEPVK